MTYFFPHMIDSAAKQNIASVSGWDLDPPRFQVRRHEFRDEPIMLDFLEHAEVARGIASEMNLNIYRERYTPATQALPG